MGGHRSAAKHLPPETEEALRRAYHELRAPLGLIATAARAGIETSNDPEAARTFATIARAAERMLRTGSLHLEGGCGVGRTRSRVVPQPVVRAVVEELRALGAPVVLDLMPEAARFAVGAGRAQFEALLQSILNNAIEHAVPETPITVSDGVRAARYWVTVSNVSCDDSGHDGHGIGFEVVRELAAAIGAAVRAGPTGAEYLTVVEIPLLSVLVHEDVADAPDRPKEPGVSADRFHLSA
ncbi:MAG: hypothetical protein ACKVVT_02395 [Dehalococcoidia bacterium]